MKLGFGHTDTRTEDGRRTDGGRTDDGRRTDGGRTEEGQTDVEVEIVI